MTEWAYTTHSGTQKKVYHTREDCRMLPESHFKRKLRNLPNNWTECQYCSGETEFGGEVDRPEVEGWEILTNSSPDDI